MKTWSSILSVQPLAGRILKNSIKKGRLSHAYLIAGSQGTGKRSLALHLAKTLLCPNREGVEPCSECPVCKRIESGNYPDAYYVEPAESGLIGMEEIMKLQREFSYSSLESRGKVYIISHADRLTVNATNRILKFLEEPTEQATAILLTENLQSIIPTVRSRCQLIELSPLSIEEFQRQIVDLGFRETEAGLVYEITKDVSEAKQLLEDDWFAELRKLMLQLIEIYLSRPEDAYTFIHSHWLKHVTKRDEHIRALELFLLAFKDFLYFHVGNEQSMVVFNKEDERLERMMMSFSVEDLLSILQAILEAQGKIRSNVHPTLVMEQLTLQIKR